MSTGPLPTPQAKDSQNPSAPPTIEVVLLELRGIFESHPLPQAFEKGMELLDRRFGVGRAGLHRLEQDSPDMVVFATYAVAKEQFRPRPGAGVVGRVSETGKPLVVPIVRQDPMALAELADPVEWGDLPWSLVALPLRGREALWGVFSAYFRSPERDGFAGRLETLKRVVSIIEDALRSRTPASFPSATTPTPAQVAEKSTLFEYANMIGSSSAMRQVYEQIGQVARTNATALLRGESGTGKELVAHAIHENSPRAAMPFVKVNCAALPESLFESELFGHERGAFTGAHARKKGRFELAQGGTLFLDEIGEISLFTQAKLLRALQSREFERLGGTETLRTDVRVIVATNRNLEEAVQKGTFREDLYYRMNVFSMTLPPLRHRRADIPALAEYFLAKFAREHSRGITRISSSALDILTHYAWPGNVRELENVMERAVVVCEDAVIREDHFPSSLKAAEHVINERPTLAQAVEALERRMITEALQNEHGNATGAARALGTSERVLRYKASKYGINAARFRS